MDNIVTQADPGFHVGSCNILIDLDSQKKKNTGLF